ncbi:MAG: GFA family protein [Pseudoxanthomonas sp.]
MKYAGSCHCGRIAFEVEGRIDQVLDCNCSMCRRRGGLLWFVPREALVLSTPEAEISTCTFNKHHLQHHFCAHCGIATFSEGVNPKTGVATAAINVHCLPEADLSVLKVVPVDGASF